MLFFGNKIDKHLVVFNGGFRLLSHFHSRLFWTAVLNGSGNFDMSLASAFVHIYFISVYKIISIALYILELFLTPVFIV